jgi:hypothetical protein
VVALIIISVWPSGAAAESISSAIWLPAPGRLSTTNVCPNASPSFTDKARVTVSMPPPAASGTTVRTGRLGYVCA